MKEGDSLPGRAWYTRDESGRPTPDSLQRALAVVDDVIEKQGPFGALLGFSQGACMVAYTLVHRPALCENLLAIIVASPDVDMGDTVLHVPSLHVMGTADAVVPVAASRSLASKFEGAEVLVHDKGHCLPSAAAFLDKIADFTRRYKKGAAAGTGVRVAAAGGAGAHHQHQQHPPRSLEPSLRGPMNEQADRRLAPALPLAPGKVISSDCAKSQEEEVEVLLSIFPDLVHVEQAAPTVVGELCACYSFALSLDDEDPASEKRVSLRFVLPDSYPISQRPTVQICSSLSMSEWSANQHRSLTQTVTQAINASDSGEACAFQAISAAIAWVADGGMASAGATAAHGVGNMVGSRGGDGVDAGGGIDAGEGDERPSWSEEEIEAHIIQCTADAGRATAGRDGVQRSQGGGVWNYVVGLVGKPSAGKSTFFNAATRALVERSGRLAAAVSAQPFTTIDPNVATSYLPVHPREGLIRFIPVVVKDVAGLVPGAYQGRGKGNKFLNDLCDADTIMHVCDATGSCDRNGNLVAAGEVGSSAAEDCTWVRRELHLWIFTNVMEKWQSVTRYKKGEESQVTKGKARSRVVQLFTGYQKDSKFLVETAASRADLDLDSAAEWTAMDVHRIVAFYLRLRFPICVAANKIDLFRDEKEMLTTVAALKKDAVERGEVVVPCSALLDSWHLLEEGRGSVPSPSGGGEGGSSSGDMCAMQDKYDSVLSAFGSTGVIEALHAAFSLNSPTIVYPVSSLDTEAPIAVRPGDGTGANLGTGIGTGVGANALRNAVVVKPQTTIYDLYEALKRRAIDEAQLSGDFVRAEGRGVDKSSRRMQVSRDSFLGEDLCVVHIMTNRKSVWQRGGVVPGGTSAGSVGAR
jgi:ribosome-binding ATPase YchF (GTP1/OBG family)